MAGGVACNTCTAVAAVVTREHHQTTNMCYCVCANDSVNNQHPIGSVVLS